MDRLALLPVWYLVFVLSTTCHEFAHAFVAYKGGDPTAYEGGQVTLDPMPHIRRSPFGMVVIPLISFLAMGGWMIGWASAPYNPHWAQRHPRRAALMSLAGPATNLLLALIAFLALRGLVEAGVFQLQGATASSWVGLPPGVKLSSPLGALATFLSVMLQLNVILGIFNLMPIPPLDGAGVAEGAAPNTAGRLYERLRAIPAFEFLGLVIAWQLFPLIAEPAIIFVLRALYS